MKLPDLGGVIDQVIGLFDGWFSSGYLYIFLGFLVIFALYIFFFA